LEDKLVKSSSQKDRFDFLTKELEQLIGKRDKYNELIDEFNFLYNLELGDILGKILTVEEKIARKLASKLLIKIDKVEENYNNLQNEYEELTFQLKNLKAKLKELDENTQEYKDIVIEIKELQTIITNTLIKLNKVKQEFFELKEVYLNDEDCQAYVEIKMAREEFEKRFEDIKKIDEKQLSKEMKKELKEIYRKASKLCHPDLIDADKKEEATKIFQQLNEAYNDKDINRLKELYESIKNNYYFIEDTQEIELKIENVVTMIDILKDTIEDIENDEIFILIQNLDDWDSYFQKTKVNLERELRDLADKLAFCLTNNTDNLDSK